MWGEVLYATLDGSRAVLRRCGFRDEDEFKRALDEIINNIKNTFKIKILDCGREVILPGGLKVDLLLIDEEGRPMIIEAKMSFNREIRRAVLGQLLEYMVRVHLSPEAVVDSCRNVIDENILEKIKEKIYKKEIIGIIASDKLPDIIKHTIEILNNDLGTMSIYGLELQKYCNENKHIQVMVPRLVGKMTKSAGMSEGKRKQLWKYMLIKDYYRNNIDDDILRKRLLDLLEWAWDNGVFQPSYSVDPVFGLKVRATDKRVITVNTDGKLDVCYGVNCRDSYKSSGDRYRLREELIKLGLLDDNTPAPDEQLYTKRTKSIIFLDNKKYSIFKNILKEILL